MTFSSRLLATTAFAVLGGLHPVRADVTADDVWQNLKVQLDAFGGTMTAPTARNGGVLTVGSIAITWELPFDAGTLSVAWSGFDLIEQGDGTVVFAYPGAIRFEAVMDITGKGEISNTIGIAHDGLFTTASGAPDDVTYAYGAGRIGLELLDISGPGIVSAPLEFRGAIEDIAGSMQIKAASLITMKSEQKLGTLSFEGRISDSGGAVTTMSGGAELSSGASSVTLPRSGTDILNLAAAFEQGMQVTGTSEMRGYRTQQTVRAGDRLVSDQKTSAEVYAANFVLNGDRLILDGTSSGLGATIEIPGLMPVPIKIQAEDSAGRLLLPVAADDQLQDAALLMDVSGLSVDESLWSMIDPGQALPRDPMKLRLDLTAKVKSFWDWFKFMDTAARGQRGELPGELHGLTVNDLTLELAGAALAGSGAAVFDNTDLATFGGFPRPAGEMDLTLTGGNRLLEQLVALGLLPEEQAAGARMMMGMVARPDPAAGDDVLKSHLEFTEDGQLLANGMRLR